MQKSAENIVRRKIKDTQAWIGKNEGFAQSNLIRLETGLAARNSAGLSKAANGLSDLGTYYGNCGLSKVIAGDRTGWDLVDRSMAYHFWSVKIHAVRYFKSPPGKAFDLTGLLSTGACLICYFLATDQLEHSSIIANLLLKGVSSPGHIIVEYWQERIFEPFVLRLHRMEIDAASPEYLLVRDLGLYSKVFEQWGDGAELATALDGLCDYHCRNMNDNGARAWDPEFKWSPFGLLPVEIAAILRVRGKLGLATPEIQHPLLETGLGKIEPRRAMTDPFLTRVESVFVEVFGDFIESD